MKPGYIIRPGVPADADRLAVLATQVWLHTYATPGISRDIAQYVLTEITPARMSAALCDAQTRVWVAEKDDCLVGMARARVGEPGPDGACRATVELQTLYVQEHFVQQGLGKLLLQTVEAFARTQASSALWLTVNALSANAIDFYRRMGYSLVGTAHFDVGNSRHENLVLLGVVRGQCNKGNP